MHADRALRLASMVLGMPSRTMSTANEAMSGADDRTAIGCAADVLGGR